MKNVFICLLCQGKKYTYKAWVYQHFKKFHPEIVNQDEYIQVAQEETKNTLPDLQIVSQKNVIEQNNCCKNCISNNEQISKLIKRVDELEKEIGKKEKNLCIACWEYESSFALQPCGHKLLCGTCAAVLLASNPHCPFCRTKVIDIIQIWEGSVCENSST